MTNQGLKNIRRVLFRVLWSTGNYYKGCKNCVSKKNQETNIDYPRNHHSTKHIFSDCTVTDKGPHYRCCYLEKHMYARNSILKGSHHRRFHRNLFAITRFQRKKTMHHCATTGNFCNFLLMGNSFHKRDIFLLEKLGENGVQQFLRAIFNSTDCLPKRKLIGYGTPRPPGEIYLIHKIKYDFLYLFDRFKFE